MNESLADQILSALQKQSYQPLKSKALARKLGVPQPQYADFRRTLKSLVRKGRVELAKNRTVRLAALHQEVAGVFRSIRGGGGFVRPRPGQGRETGDIYVKAKDAGDAVTGDVVLVTILKFSKDPSRGPSGRVREVIERSTRNFVGTYRTAEGEGLVRVDGRMFHEDIFVGDAGAKGARDGDKIVFEMLRFPSPEFTGEGVVTEVLGPRAQPGVDLKSVIRQFHLPDEFPPEALEEARQQARQHAEQEIDPERRDLTDRTTVTVDPPDAKDFDDAISLERDERGFWHLDVHIADVSTFVQPGSVLDTEARRRATSVYLPGTVLPMIPELISNGLASLQQGRVRFTKSVFVEFDPEGHITAIDFANAAIRVTCRLTYEQVKNHWEGEAPVEPATDDDPDVAARSVPNREVRELLDRMRELASILRKRRRKRGLFELDMPQPVLEYDADGRICGAHSAESDESHQMIEEFMVTANEAVAQKLAGLGITFLRRIHEDPDPQKLKGFAEFARSVGVRIDDYRSRFELQRVLQDVAGTPPRHAVHYALLRSLKLAAYSPEEEGHYGLASDCYCHFTSPIRRYPDLVIHRLLGDLLRKGTAGSDHGSLVVLGEHCSFAARRADRAERELIRIKLLEHLASRVGEEMDMLITGVEEFGFFAAGLDFPAEGLVHIRTLSDDYYSLDRATHSLIGRRTGNCYQLGHRVRCVLWRIDHEQRQLDLRLSDKSPKTSAPKSVDKTSKRSAKPPRKKKSPKKTSRRKRRR